MLRNAVDTDTELSAFASDADKIIKNLNLVHCLDTDKDASSGFRNRQVSGIKGIRNLLTTLKRLGLIDSFNLCEQPVQQTTSEKVSVPALSGGAICVEEVKKPSRSKTSRQKGSKRSKGSKRATKSTKRTSKKE
jgi:hypothetical protein